MALAHHELVRIITWFAQLYLEIEAARRHHRPLLGRITPALADRLPHGRRQPVTGALTVGGATYTHTGATIRAAVVVYRGEQPGALLLTFRQIDRRWKLAEVEAPDHTLLPAP